MGVKQLLSEAQRNELMDLSRLTEWDLVTFHTFSKHDLHLIFKHRRGYNRLGFALQLALIRYPGWALTEYNDIPMSVIKHIARQLQIPAEEFSKYYGSILVKFVRSIISLIFLLAMKKIC